MPYSRRTFLKDGARLAAFVKAGNLPALSFPGDIRKTIGIQIGPDSLVDEGTEKALDILEGCNALM